MTQIFKIQIPINNHQGVLSPMFGVPAMAYNKDKSIRVLLPITDELQKIMGGKLKKFVRAEYIENGAKTDEQEFKIVEREIEDRDW